ncbi:MAG TPA: hypothetical protein VFT47_09590 [Vicinamibacterales bacterium]|nr:hypothetical protein [Vicinamibacterales bacterium]
MPNVLLAMILSMVGAFVLPIQHPEQQAANSPFAGSWSADLSRSRLDPKLALKGADITFSVTGNVITLASSVVLPSGETIQERDTLRADGTETAAVTPGAMHVANWVGSHVLALITKKGNQNLALITSGNGVGPGRSRFEAILDERQGLIAFARSTKPKSLQSLCSFRLRTTVDFAHWKCVTAIPRLPASRRLAHGESLSRRMVP